MNLRDIEFNVMTMSGDGVESYDAKFSRIKTLANVKARIAKMDKTITRAEREIEKIERVKDNTTANRSTLLHYADLFLGDAPFYILLSKFDTLNSKLDDCPNVLDLFDEIINHNWLHVRKQLGLVNSESIVYLVTTDKNVVCVNRPAIVSGENHGNS